MQNKFPKQTLTQRPALFLEVPFHTHVRTERNTQGTRKKEWEKPIQAERLCPGLGLVWQYSTEQTGW